VVGVGPVVSRAAADRDDQLGRGPRLHRPDGSGRASPRLRSLEVLLAHGIFARRVAAGARRPAGTPPNAAGARLGAEPSARGAASNRGARRAPGRRRAAVIWAFAEARRWVRFAGVVGGARSGRDRLDACGDEPAVAPDDDGGEGGAGARSAAGAAARAAPERRRAGARRLLPRAGGLRRRADPRWAGNSWNQFHCGVSADLVMEFADAMVDSGMRDAGYEYVNIDDCWLVPSVRRTDGSSQQRTSTRTGAICWSAAWSSGAARARAAPGARGTPERAEAARRPHRGRRRGRRRRRGDPGESRGGAPGDTRAAARTRAAPRGGWRGLRGHGLRGERARPHQWDRDGDGLVVAARRASNRRPPLLGGTDGGHGDRDRESRRARLARAEAPGRRRPGGRGAGRRRRPTGPPVLVRRSRGDARDRGARRERQRRQAPIPTTSTPSGSSSGSTPIRGAKPAGHRAGSGGHEPLDASTFAAWGIDYSSMTTAPRRGDERAGLPANGRGPGARHRLQPLRLEVLRVGRRPRTLWRTTSDIEARWESILGNASVNYPFAPTPARTAGTIRTCWRWAWAAG
jgi:hypothetical protein